MHIYKNKENIFSTSSKLVSFLQSLFCFLIPMEGLGGDPDGQLTRGTKNKFLTT
jgi:hypothetical protein